ncbi:fibrosin-1-like protein isoform X2 [Mustelus asterias]
MELPPRAGSYRQSRRSRSQRDRERKMTGAGGRDPRPYSPSSGSDREAGEAPGSSRPRPPRRRRRESTSCEEDIIDGFAIASFPTLEALEDAVPKPPERVDSQRKRQEKRKPEENQPGSPCEGARGAEGSERDQNRRNGERNPPPTKKVKTKGPTRGNQSTGGENGSSQRSSSRGAGSDVSAHSSLGTGYFCDIDSDPDDKPLGDAALCNRRLGYTKAQDKALHDVWQRISFVSWECRGLSEWNLPPERIHPLTITPIEALSLYHQSHRGVRGGLYTE